MAGETPDWGVLSAQQTVFPVTDLGELAGRLGSIVTYDRRGDVVVVDDFSAGLASWTRLQPNGDEVVDLTTQRVLTGRFAVRLVNSASSAFNAGIRRNVPGAVKSRIGLEFAFGLVTTDSRVEAELRYFDGVDEWLWSVRWNDTGDLVEVLQAGGTYATLASDVILDVGSGTFHFLKLVIDMNTKAYVRALLNRRTFDLSAYSAQDVGSSTSDRLQLTVRAEKPGGGAQRTVYVDNVVVTQNEPA